jgi:hypothetical protein
MADSGVNTIRTVIPTVLAEKLKKFCKRVGLSQPAIIRTLVFNALTTYYPATEEKKTSLVKGARFQQRHFDEYERGTTVINAVLNAHQVTFLDEMADGIGLSCGDVIRVLIRNFVRTTRPGRAEDAFLLTARQLMSRLPSSPQWGHGAERTAGQRQMQVYDFMDEHPNLSPGEIAASLRSLGIRHSREWIKEWR